MASKSTPGRPVRKDEEGGMILSPDQRSLRRGRRRAPRTQVCRPCLVWVPEQPEEKHEGVLLDLNPHGMRLRAVESFDETRIVVLQMMRDEHFQVPLSVEIRARIVRRETTPSGLTDLGLAVLPPEIRRPNEGRILPLRRTTTTRRQQTRMHTVDFLVGERYPGRRRG